MKMEDLVHGRILIIQNLSFDDSDYKSRSTVLGHQYIHRHLAKPTTIYVILFFFLSLCCDVWMTTSSEPLVSIIHGHRQNQKFQLTSAEV